LILDGAHHWRGQENVAELPKLNNEDFHVLAVSRDNGFTIETTKLKRPNMGWIHLV
jgi:hypothetical protein